MPYMDMARGSPWVVPSLEYTVSPSMNKEASPLYMLVVTTANDGHSEWMLTRAALRFKELKVLVTSTSKNGFCFFIIEDSPCGVDSSLTA